MSYVDETKASYLGADKEKIVFPLLTITIGIC